MPENKLNIENQVELARTEEKISKQKAIQLWQGNELKNIEKYVEMNVAHPFREGNGRSMRLWLDDMDSKKFLCYNKKNFSLSNLCENVF